MPLGGTKLRYRKDNGDGQCHIWCLKGKRYKFRDDEPGTRSLMNWLWANGLERVEWYAMPRKREDCGQHEVLSFDLTFGDGKDLRCELLRCTATPTTEEMGRTR